MAKVIITKNLQEEIFKKFKAESEKIFILMKSLESNPNKGKTVGNVGGVVIKELKYGKFRFYFITDGHLLKFGNKEEIASLLIKFIRMSEKKDQEKVIKEIKRILNTMGFESL